MVDGTLDSGRHLVASVHAGIRACTTHPEEWRDWPFEAPATTARAETVPIPERCGVTPAQETPPPSIEAEESYERKESDLS